MRFRSVALFVAGLSLAGAPAVANAQSRQCDVIVHILAALGSSNANETTDPQLRGLQRHLKPFLTYKVYHLAARIDAETRCGNKIELPLPGGRILRLEPHDVRQDTILAKLTLLAVAQVQPIMEGEVELRANRTLVLQPYRRQGLIVAVRATAIHTIHIENRRESAGLMLKFEQLMRRDPENQILRAIELGKPLLKDNGGPFSEAELDDLLGDFELMAAAYRVGLINRELTHAAFSYYLDRTLKNPEVEAYLRSIRKDEPDLYEGVDELAVALGITPPSKASASSSPPKP